MDICSVFSLIYHTPPLFSTYANRIHDYLSAEVHYITDKMERPYQSCILETPDEDDSVVWTYKQVAQKVCPVPGVLPEEFRIIRRRHPDPLRNLPSIQTKPVAFEPCGKLTKERLDALKIDRNDFLWPEEK